MTLIDILALACSIYLYRSLYWESHCKLWSLAYIIVVWVVHMVLLACWFVRSRGIPDGKAVLVALIVSIAVVWMLNIYVILGDSSIPWYKKPFGTMISKGSHSIVYESDCPNVAIRFTPYSVCTNVVMMRLSERFHQLGSKKHIGPKIIGGLQKTRSGYVMEMERLYPAGDICEEELGTLLAKISRAGFAHPDPHKKNIMRTSQGDLRFVDLDGLVPLQSKLKNVEKCH